MKYRIVEADNSYSLGEKVKTLIEDGWEPLGGICTIFVGHGRVEYYQAMVKRNDTCTLEEALESAVNAMEEEGVDFKEEVGCVFLSLPNREDLEITLYVVDKKVSEMFNKEELH